MATSASLITRRHNERVLADLKPGDLVSFDRGSYYDWAKYTGDGKVKSVARPDSNILIRCLFVFRRRAEDDFWKVAGDSKAYKENNLGDMKRNRYEKHNKRVLEDLRPGDLVSFDRFFFYHWAVYTGDKKVTHAEDPEEGKISPLRALSFILGRASAEVHPEGFMKVAGVSMAYRENNLVNQYEPYTGDEVVRRATQRIGPYPYHLLSRNCEHFAMWCRYGERRSAQARRVKTVFLAFCIGLCCAVPVWVHLRQKL